MNKNVYFAGSIRGGREDAELYRQIIEHIQKTDIVLTEHVGDLSLSLAEAGDKDRIIYDQDTAWLRQADLVIAECTSPSLGVGYELAYAEHLGTPCYIFYRKSKTNLSAMLAGDPYFQICAYESLEEILPVIDRILQDKQQ